MAEQKVYTNAEIGVALRAALDAKGEDYVYEKDWKGGCHYAVNGEPACILGHVLKVLDPEAFEWVAVFENDWSQNGGDTSFGNVADALGLPFHKEQLSALKAMQRHQDNGTPWGTVVANEWIAALGERL